MAPLSWYIVILILMTPRPGLGCFHKVEPLMRMPGWVQATGIYSYLQYDIGMQPDYDDDMIYVNPRGKEVSGKKVLKCIRAYSSNQVLVQVVSDETGGRPSTSMFQCLRFKSLSSGLLRLTKTQEKSSKKEVNCETDPYSDNMPVLIAQNGGPFEPCPLQGSYQALLYNGRDTKTLCTATFRFQCNNQRVMITFGSNCKPPVFKYYSNKPRHQRSIYLDCVGGWNEGENTKMLVLSKTDEPLSYWCLHYTSGNGSSEFLSAYLSFDGNCKVGAFNEEFVKLKDSMHGHLARIFPSSHRTCAADYTANHCPRKDVKCSETNECPSKCQRCYNIPKTDVCKFSPSTFGRWETVNSNHGLTVDIKKDGVKTPVNGKFLCNPEMEKTSAYPVVQYDKAVDCMPLYACVHIFRLSPGVLNFYLRPSIIDEAGEPLTCQKTNEIFQTHPFPEGEMVTLINVEKVQEVACDFGNANQFDTSGDCIINVAGCSGKCRTLDVSFDNETCREESPGVTLARQHRCHASLKFRDGIRGLITYSDVLEKYSCWVFTSTRLFVMEPYKCNDEAVAKLYSDKYAAKKYDPFSAFTIPQLDTPSRGTLTLSQSICVWLLFSILFVKTFF